MDTKDLLFLIGLVLTFASSLMGGIPAFKKARMDYNVTNIDSINRLSRQVNELIIDNGKLQDRIDEQDKRIDDLQKDLRKYVNAYGKAVRFIQKHTDVDIPNFLETDPKIEGAK